MSSVRISRKLGLALLDSFQRAGPTTQRCMADFDRMESELRRALEPRPKSSQVKRTEKKRRAKSASTKEIRAAVMERAGGKCEHCGFEFHAANAAELDHQWGRGKEKQTVENCRALCRIDHRRKTLNEPSAAYWLMSFRLHAEKHGYFTERERAQRRLDAIRLSRGAP